MSLLLVKKMAIKSNKKNLIAISLKRVREVLKEKKSQFKVLHQFAVLL